MLETMQDEPQRYLTIKLGRGIRTGDYEKCGKMGGRRWQMALPVAETPVLRGRAAREFERKLREDLKKPSRLTETPKLEAARNAVKAYVAARKN
jgi:hypothetical protein